jgi:hypothetical protein
MHTEHIGEVLDEQAIVLDLPIDRVHGQSFVLDDNFVCTRRGHGSMVNL